MKKYLDFCNRGKVIEVVFQSNGVVLGEVVQDVDGSWLFWDYSNINGGAWSWWILAEIVEFMKKKDVNMLREPISNEVSITEFGNENKKEEECVEK